MRSREGQVSSAGQAISAPTKVSTRPILHFCCTFKACWGGRVLGPCPRRDERHGPRRPWGVVPKLHRENCVGGLPPPFINGLRTGIATSPQHEVSRASRASGGWCGSMIVEGAAIWRAAAGLSRPLRDKGRFGNGQRSVSTHSRGMTWASVADGCRHGAVRLAASQAQRCAAVGWAGQGIGGGSFAQASRRVALLTPCFATPRAQRGTRVPRHRRLAAGGLGESLV
jgi:hypothetical protein